MKNFLIIPFLLLFVFACDSYDTYYKVDGEVMSTDAYENAEIAEKFVDLVLNVPMRRKNLFMMILNLGIWGKYLFMLKVML